MTSTRESSPVEPAWELLDRAPGIHVLTDGGGTIARATGADVKALGVRPAFLDGRSILSYVLPSYRHVVRALLERGDETPRPLAIQMRGRKGIFDATFELHRSSEGNVLSWTIVCRKNEAETTGAAEPERSGHQLARAFHRLNQGIVVVDGKLRVVGANASARALLGVALRPATPLPADVDGLRDLAARAFAAVEVLTEEIPRGEDGVLRTAAIPPERPDDGVVIVLTRLDERERLESIEREFVANASHELRTPLATISAAIEILQGGAKESADARDRFLVHIEREVSRLARLVNALLTLARVQAGQELPELVRMRVRPVLEEVAAVVPAKEGVEVVVVCPPRVEVFAHPELLLEIVVNLAANAAKYTSEGRIVLAAVPSRRTVLIEVRDTGRGIPRESLDLLFERFYRGDERRGEGFGLGLSIVRQAVTVLGGGIEVDSEPGSGTTVRVILPQPTSRARAEAA